MTKEQECIKALFLLVDHITEKAIKKDPELMKIFRSSGTGGCDAYQGMPPIARTRDGILHAYEEIIYQALKEESE